MRKFKHILLVISDKDDDNAAIECALELAKHNKASLKVIKVVDDLSKFIKVSKLFINNNVNVTSVRSLSALRNCWLVLLEQFNSRQF